MKIKTILPAAILLLLASCGGGQSHATGLTSESSHATGLSTLPSSSSASLPTFEATALSTIHDARVADTVATLEDKYVAIKGKVTFAKHVSELYNALIIQDGKNAIEVDYPESVTVNVGDAIEVKGRLKTNKVGDVTTVWVSTDTASVPGASIKVINESIAIETVTISKVSDLLEYQNSQSSITFSVTGNRSNAAFIGKLSQGDDEIIVSNKLGIAEKFEEPPYAVGDTCKYTGVFSYSSSDVKVVRYYDKAGFTKLN